MCLLWLCDLWELFEFGCGLVKVCVDWLDWDRLMIVVVKENGKFFLEGKILF